MKKYLIIVFTSFIFTSCSSQSCTDLPTEFESYSSAQSHINKTDFKFEESEDTSKSSWIRRATYYSCDNSTGFLVIGTDNQSYIHSSVPKSHWIKFKNSESFGRYYNSQFKGRYPLKNKIVDFAGDAKNRAKKIPGYYLKNLQFLYITTKY